MPYVIIVGDNRVGRFGLSADGGVTSKEQMCSIRSFLIQHFGNGDDELALHVWEWAMRAQDAVSHDSDPPSNCARCKDQLGAYFLFGDSGECRPRHHPRMCARAY
jgi:hypothetical protein